MRQAALTALTLVVILAASAGAAGPTHHYVTKALPVGPHKSAEIHATCPYTTTVTGGGFELTGKLHIRASEPTTRAGIGVWTVDVTNPTGRTLTARSYAVCDELGG